MTDFPSYSFGTVTVAADGTTITGTDTIWSGTNARAGDDITIDGNTVIIVAVTDETTLVIDAWPYAAVTGGTYKITQRSPLRFVGGQARADLTTLLATLKAKGLLWYLDPAYSEPDAANPPLTADEGQAILKIDTGALWVMQGGAWVAAGSFKVFVFKGAYDAGTTYAVSDVVTYAGSAYLVIAATTGNAPPNATYYSLLASKGDAATIAVGTVTTGASGSAAAVSNSGTSGAAVLDFTIPAGKGYGGTSTTSLAIGTGSKAFTTQSGLAYVDGARVRASSAADTSNWMEGLATYSGTTLAIVVNKTNNPTALTTPVNAAFSTATVGGTLPAGTYYYRVSAINSTGETLASTETSQVTTGTTSTVTVNWGAVTGATGYKIYGRTTGAELLVATVGAVTTYIDDGSITPAGALPTTNTTTTFADWNLNVVGEPGAGDLSSANNLSDVADKAIARTNLGIIYYDTVAAATAATIPVAQNAVHTGGYGAVGDGGAALYKKVGSAPSHNGKFQSVDGAWWEIVGSDLSPRQFGAVVDGVTDDAPAFLSCCQSVLEKGGGRVRLPEGTMRLKSTIALTVATGLHLVIEGTGTYTSVLSYSDLATDGITFTSSVTTANQHPTLELLNFSIEISKKAAGTAITASWENNLNLERPFSMDKVEIRQCITRISDTGADYGYWTRGVYLNNARNSYIANSYFFGEMDLSPQTSIGIELGAECTFFTIHNVLILETTTGIYIGGTTEGIKMTSCSIVACRYGAQFHSSSGAQPELVVTGCDFNCANVGVWTENIQMVKLQGCTFFAYSGLDIVTWPEWTGVSLQGTNGRYSKVIGCSFTKESGRTGDVTLGIDANGSGGSMLAVIGCDFYGFSGNTLTYGVIERAGYTGVVVDPSCQFEYVTNPFDNSGSTSHRLCKTIGGLAASVASGGSVTFPNAFPEDCISVVAIHDGTNTALNCTVSNVTASSFVINHNNGSPASFRWIAVGY